jgi:hypothetical protein
MAKEEVSKSSVYRQFESATSFKNGINLINDINRSVMFENGKQWNMDDDIKDFPKITINIIKQIGKIRKSNVMQNEYSYLVNSTNFKSIRKVQDFLKHLSNVVKMKFKDLKALNDDYMKGTAVGYFYWDAEKRGFLKKSGGEMRYEIIDIRNFVVANPYIQSIQDQEWVIYNTREKLNSLNFKYNKDNNIKIIPDGNLYTSGTEVEPVADTQEEELVNVYTKFYRNYEGQVFFTIATQHSVLKGPTPLNPFYNKTDSKEAPNTTSLPDSKIKKDKRTEHVWNLYPFARLCLNERDNCFYGLPITLEYIDAQKSINNHFSVYDKAIQDNVLGGFVFRKGILDAQTITTENGQMLGLDTLPNEPIQNSFQRLPVANVPADSVKYSDGLIQATRQVAGASNVQLGMSDYAGQSGKQTQLLLQRAQENASDTAMMFNEFKSEQAYIMLLFAKFYYDNENFIVIEHGDKKDNAREYKGENAFSGIEYLDDDVTIDIKVGTGVSFSEYTNVELAGLMVQSGQIPFEAYVTMLPEGYISNKQEVLEIAEQNSLKQIQALQEQMKQMQMVMEQMAKAYEDTKKDRKNIDTVITENERLKSLMADISARAIERVANADNTSREVTEEMQNILRTINGRKQ